jgi:hypothetical protein
MGSTRLQERYQFAVDATRAAGAGASSVRFEKLMDLSQTDPTIIVELALEVLQVEDQFSAADKAALVTYLGPGPIDFLGSESTFNNKLRGLFGLIIQSPAYQLY